MKLNNKTNETESSITFKDLHHGECFVMFDDLEVDEVLGEEGAPVYMVCINESDDDDEGLPTAIVNIENGTICAIPTKNMRLIRVDAEVKVSLRRG